MDSQSAFEFRDFLRNITPFLLPSLGLTAAFMAHQRRSILAKITIFWASLWLLSVVARIYLGDPISNRDGEIMDAEGLANYEREIVRYELIWIVEWVVQILYFVFLCLAIRSGMKDRRKPAAD